MALMMASFVAALSSKNVRFFPSALSPSFRHCRMFSIVLTGHSVLLKVASTLFGPTVAQPQVFRETCHWQAWQTIQFSPFLFSCVIKKNYLSWSAVEGLHTTGEAVCFQFTFFDLTFKWSVHIVLWGGFCKFACVIAWTFLTSSVLSGSLKALEHPGWCQVMQTVMTGIRQCTNRYITSVIEGIQNSCSWTKSKIKK